MFENKLILQYIYDILKIIPKFAWKTDYIEFFSNFNIDNWQRIMVKFIRLNSEEFKVKIEEYYGEEPDVYEHRISKCKIFSLNRKIYNKLTSISKHVLKQQEKYDNEIEASRYKLIYQRLKQHCEFYISKLAQMTKY